MRGGKTRPEPQSVSVLDFLQMDLPPRLWLVEPLIQERDITMVHAWRGVGKTHFVMHLAWSVASGAPFLRYVVPQPAGVLLVDGEMAVWRRLNDFGTEEGRRSFETALAALGSCPCPPEVQGRETPSELAMRATVQERGEAWKSRTGNPLTPSVVARLVTHARKSK